MPKHTKDDLGTIPDELRGPPDSAWHDQHLAAIISPRGSEVPHVMLYRAIKAMASQRWHADGYAGEHVLDVVRNAHALLNMDSGRLDCGTLDGFYMNVLRACGVEE